MWLRACALTGMQEVCGAMSHPRQVATSKAGLPTVRVARRCPPPPPQVSAHPVPRSLRVAVGLGVMLAPPSSSGRTKMCECWRERAASRPRVYVLSKSYT